MSQHASIEIVHPSNFNKGTSQTPGSERLAAISGENGVRSGMWGGMFTVQPGAQTGIHHHGQQETVAYVLEGEAHVRWGERGEFEATVSAGDFLHVPGGLPHREANRSSIAPFRWVVVRSTPEPIVVNLPDNFWD